MRQGLRICNKGGHPEVRDALIRFARWLRENYEFPIRVPVYLYPAELINIRGEKGVASIFEPYDRTVEPYIRMATGDYPTLKRQDGRDNALAAFICTLSRQVVRYQVWLTNKEPTKREISRKATAMLRKYEKTTDHP